MSKIIPSRCQIFHLKCNKFNFGWSSAPNAAGEQHYYTPLPPGWIWATRREKGRIKEKERGEKGKGEVEGEGGMGKGKFFGPFIFPACAPAQFPLNAPCRSIVTNPL